MVPKTGASLSCPPLSFVLSSRRSSIVTRDAEWSRRKMKPWQKKEVFIASRKDARLAQKNDPPVIKNSERHEFRHVNPLAR